MSVTVRWRWDFAPSSFSHSITISRCSMISALTSRSSACGSYSSSTMPPNRYEHVTVVVREGRPCVATQVDGSRGLYGSCMAAAVSWSAVANAARVRAPLAIASRVVALELIVASRECE